MTETQTVMVLQLAKELGMPPLALVDSLKALNINVKSHMSELTIEQATMARASLAAAAEAQKASAKKTTIKKATPVRKKVAEPAEEAAPAPKSVKKATSASAEPKAETPKAAPRKRVSAAAAAAAEAEAAAAKAAASPIIRRRTKADGVTETVTHNPATGTAVTTTHAPGDEEAAAQAQTAVEPDAMIEAQEAQAPVEVEVEQPVVEVAPTETPAPQVTITPAAPPVPGTAAARPTPVRKSVLKIVEAAPVPIKPMIKPPSPSPGSAGKITPRGSTTTQDKDGYRIIKMTKENLDQMVEEEAAKKRGGGGGKEGILRPEDVRFADYRKKEMVFLPRKKKLPVGKEIRQTEITEKAAHKRVVEIQDSISVQDLAAAMSIKAPMLIRKLMGLGQMATINQVLDFDTATLVAAEFQYEVKNVAFKEEELLNATTDAPEKLVPRPPVVTIMGHVDHGKTTLLDSIREANVAAGEAGGITQHIGAYTVEKNGKLITFIDTPGHEAFTVMRARGANVTDIVILVVAADDGVMPQTREALSHAQAAKVPIIVAVNKIDKPGANPEKIKQGLAELNLLSEDWGGETMFVPVSALKKTGIDKLLESILLQAEVLDLKSNPNTEASGTVLEARVEKGRGPVASLLVRRGTLKVGDAVVSGPYSGRVKAMIDDKGRMLKSVTPGMAAEILGFDGVASAGEPFNVTASEGDAKRIATSRVDKARAKASPTAKSSLDTLFAKMQAGEVKTLDVILKTDVFGSMEAVRDSLIKLSTEKVKVNVLHAAPGGITESDVLLATASNALIIGFNVRPETKARQVAEAEHIEIRTYTIIYELIDDVKKAMTGLLDKKKVEKFLGRAEVRQTFTVPKIGVIAGSSVIDGKILRGANVRLLRDSRVIYEGKMSSLKRFKDDAKEVAQGYECGIGIENFNDIKPGDLIEAYQIDLIAPELT